MEDRDALPQNHCAKPQRQRNPKDFQQHVRTCVIEMLKSSLDQCFLAVLEINQHLRALNWRPCIGIPVPWGGWGTPDFQLLLLVFQQKRLAGAAYA